MKKIEELLDKINSSSEDAKFSAWMEIYTSDNLDLKSFLFNLPFEQSPVLKNSCIRFLGHIQEERAIRLLVRFLEDADDIVVDSAIRSFERNLYNNKTYFLIDALDSQNRKTVFFAIEKICKAGIYEALNKLYSMLDRNDERLMIKLLMGFRYMPDRGMLRVVEGFIYDQREKVRFYTTFVYGALYESNIREARKFLLRLLRDESKRIRQVALWSLRKNKRLWDIQYYLKLSTHDSDPTVKQEALMGLSQFDYLFVIRHLLKIIVYEQNRLVVLKAESILINYSPKRIVKALRKMIVNNDRKIMSKALLYYAEFEKNKKSFFNFLIKGLRCSNVKDKLPFIEALGAYGDSNGIKFLEKSLGESPLEAYAAMSAILKIHEYNKTNGFVNYLKDDNCSNLLKQMVLKQLVRMKNIEKSDYELAEMLLDLLHSPNLNIRYLSTQALVLIMTDEFIVPFFEVLLKENDPASLNLLQKNVSFLLQNNCLLFADLYSNYINKPDAIKLLFNVLFEASLPSSEFIRLLKGIHARNINIYSSTYVSDFMNYILYYLQSGYVELSDIVQLYDSLEDKVIFLKSLEKVIRDHPNMKISISIDQFKTIISQVKNQDEKRVLLSLLGFSKSDNVIPLILEYQVSENIDVISQSILQVMGMDYD